MSNSAHQNKGILVKYFYSACVLTSTENVTILHDPWFTDGIYDGSWYQYPKIEDPIAAIGDVDYIYISHIHPDHYDPTFLKRYFQQYGEKPILIANFKNNHLEKKMIMDGFSPIVLKEPMYISNTKVEIYADERGSASDVDSALIIKYDGERTHCVLNANDIIFEKSVADKLKAICGRVDIFLCGYTGAGPYPQTYFELNAPELVIEAEKKREEFFDRYRRFTNIIKAKINIPFAGKYILGGHLYNLNNFRGVADAVEVQERIDNTVVLADNGGSINTVDLNNAQLRVQRYDRLSQERYASSLRKNAMAYEKLISEDEVTQLPLKRLLAIAMRRAHERSECLQDYYFCIHLDSGEIAILNANKHSLPRLQFATKESELPVPRTEILIDNRYLFGLLTHVYHWNNAEVGSQYASRRTPNLFSRSAQSFLNFLAV